MDYIDDVEKEITTIYLCDKIEKNGQLILFALYHSFYNYIAYSIEDNVFADNCHGILKEELLKYCRNITNNKKLNYRDFIIGYLNTLKNTLLDDYAYYFLGEIDSIIHELTWVDKINKRELSFDTKTKLVMIINNIINNINYHFENVMGEEKSKSIKNDYKDTLIYAISNFEVENYSLRKFIFSLKMLTKYYIKEKVDNNEIDLNSINDEELNGIYSYFNDEEKVVLKTILIHIICDIPAEDFEQDMLLAELSEELGMSVIKTKKVVNSFAKKWARFTKSVSKENNNCKKLKILGKNFWK